MVLAIELAPSVGIALACRALGVARAGFYRRQNHQSRRVPQRNETLRQERSMTPNAATFLTCSTRPSSWIGHPHRSTPHCWIKAFITVPQEQCIESCMTTSKCESVEINCNIRSITSQN